MGPVTEIDTKAKYALMDMHDWEKVCNRPTLVATEDEGTDQGSARPLPRLLQKISFFFIKVKICIKWKKLLQEQKILPWNGRTYFKEWNDK